MSKLLLLKKEHFKSVFNTIISVFTRNQQFQGGDNIPNKDETTLELINLKLDLVNLKLDKLTMAMSDEFKTVLTRIDKFSTDVAGLLTPIAAKLDLLSQNLGSMTQAEEDAVKVDLAADADKLEAAAAALTLLGADPTNPTPPTP